MFRKKYAHQALKYFFIAAIVKIVYGILLNILG